MKCVALAFALTLFGQDLPESDVDAIDDKPAAKADAETSTAPGEKDEAKTNASDNVEDKDKDASSEKDEAKAESTEDETAKRKRPSLGGRRGKADEKRSRKDAKSEESAPPSEVDRGIPQPDAVMPERSDLDRKLLEGLGQDLENVPEQDEEDDPLMRVGRRMRDVEERLARLDATEENIQTQRQILEDLNELLKQAQNNQNNQNQNQNQQRQPNPQQQQDQQQQQQQQQQQGQQQQEGDEPRDRAGPPRPATARGQQPADPRQTKDVWGHLSAMMREEMSQYAKDGFLPKYREMLEKYYSDIAERSRSSN